MESFELVFKPSVHKDLKALHKAMVSKVLEKIEGLRIQPMRGNIVKLEGADRLYRLRVGDYRVVFEVNASTKQVVVHHIRHRRDVYRGL